MRAECSAVKPTSPARDVRLHPASQPRSRLGRVAGPSVFIQNAAKGEDVAPLVDGITARLLTVATMTRASCSFFQSIDPLPRASIWPFICWPIFYVRAVAGVGTIP